MDLREQIEDIFSGIVFFMYRFFAAQVEIVRRPLRATARLYKKNLDPDAKEIGPYSMLVVSVIFAYGIFFATHTFKPEETLFGIINGSAHAGLWAQIVASFIVVVVFDLWLRQQAHMSFAGDRRRRQRFVSVMLYATSPVVFISSLIVSLVYPSTLFYGSWIYFPNRIGSFQLSTITVGVFIILLIVVRCVAPAWSSVFRSYDRLMKSANDAVVIHRMRRWLWARMHLTRRWFVALSAGSVALLFGVLTPGVSALISWALNGKVQVVGGSCDVPASVQSPLTGYVILRNDALDDTLVGSWSAAVFPPKEVDPNLSRLIPVHLEVDAEGHAVPVYVMKPGETKVFFFRSVALTWNPIPKAIGCGVFLGEDEIEFMDRSLGSVTK